MNAIVLRAATEEDLDLVLASENAPEHAPFVGRWTRQQHLSALEGEEFECLIVVGEQDLPVGHVILADCNDSSRNLMLKRIIITHKGQGYGRAALKEVQRIAFNQYKAHRLWLDVIETNTRARSLYQTIGFQEEGTLREALLHHGQYVSLVIMSMLATEYQG